MSSPTSENYDGAVPRGHKRRRLTLGAGTPAAAPSRGRHPMHGVGAQAGLRYCECGAKKRADVCPRCDGPAA